MTSVIVLLDICRMNYSGQPFCKNGWQKQIVLKSFIW